MLRLSIHRAAPGMVLAAPVLHPDKPEHVLLKPGAVLDTTAIMRLGELNVRMVCIEYPPTAYLMRYVSPAIIAEQGRLASRVGACIDAVSGNLHARFDFLEYLTGIRSLMHTLVSDPAAALFVEDIVEAPQPLVGHSFNVGMLSLLMGLRLDGYLVASRPRVHVRRARNVENLGIGGLLHDIGMLRLPKDVLARYFRTGDEKDEEWQRHVNEGYSIVRGRIPPTAAAAVLHHHQRLDGSGFPRRARQNGPPRSLIGREIHIFTRVIALADVFERSRRPVTGGGMVVPTVRALKRTLELVRGGSLDPVVFRALLTVVPAFAPGSVIKLNDERTYVVTAWHPSRPCRPTVARISGEDLGLDQSSSLLGPMLDMRVRPELRVVSAEGQNITEDLFDEISPGEFDLRTPYPHGLVEPCGDTAPFNMPLDGSKLRPPSKRAG